MKKVTWIYQIFLGVIIVFLAAGCKKEEITDDIVYPITHWPVVKALESTNITNSTATLNGTVNAHGLRTTVTFEYGTTTSYGSIVTATQSPVTGDSITNVSVDISGLTPCMPYHFRIRAENSLWTNFYDSDNTFNTGLPTLTTTSISGITATTAKVWGNITDNGCTAITAQGICWSTTANPTTSDSKNDDGVGMAQFVSSINGLIPGTTYHVRAYATNSFGTAYSADMKFTLLEKEAPIPSTQNATDISQEYATLNGTVIANDFSTTVTFEYGITTSYGSTVTAYQSPITGNGITIVYYQISGLRPFTTYHFRVKAESSHGTVYGDDLTFITLGLQAPSAVKQFVTNESATRATLNGTVIANDLSTTVTFEYGTTTSYGSTVAASQSPVTGDSIKHVSADISGLTPGTTYYFRLKAENSDGTVYRIPVWYIDETEFTTFTCSQGPTVKTLAATNISITGATLNGTVNANGLNTKVSFWYWSGRSLSQRYVDAVQSPLAGDSTINVSANILRSHGYKLLEYKIVAENSCGRVDGIEMSFIYP